MVSTDSALITLFDGQVVSEQPSDEIDYFPIVECPGVKKGFFAAFEVGSDGTFDARVTDGPLTDDERDYAACLVKSRVVVKSGNLWVSGYGFEPLSIGPTNLVGQSFAVEPGVYNIEAYFILWQHSPRWWCESDAKRPDSPPDLVFQLTPASQSSEFIPPGDIRLDAIWLPFIETQPSPFLFPSSGRVMGTQPGMRLTTETISDPKTESGIHFKKCGIENYRLELFETPSLEPGTRITVEVISVHHLKMTISARFIEVV
jgi:hypothetical protein